MIGVISGQAGRQADRQAHIYPPSPSDYFSGFLGKSIASALRARGYGGHRCKRRVRFTFSGYYTLSSSHSLVGWVEEGEKVLTKSPESISCRLKPQIVNSSLGKVPHLYLMLSYEVPISFRR